jgi:glycosyltransferase involved in cell wall biosynthesis
LIAHQFLVSRELGGAGLTALHLARHFQEYGKPGSVWVPGDGPAQQEAWKLGLEVRSYRASWALSRWKWKAALENLRVAGILRRHQGGIVHVHGPVHYGSLHRGFRLAGLRQVVHVQIEEDPGLLAWAFRRPPWLIITCARFLVEHVRRTLPEEHQERQRIVAVPNAVDIERYCPADKGEAKRRVGAPLASPLVLMLANLAPHKGQETAIQAVALLKQRGIHVDCWLVGGERGGATSYTTHLQSLIRQLGVQDRIQLLGFRSDGADLLRAADFFVLPSSHEGLPLALLEAQATKVPVLAAPTAGIPEVVTDGEHGFLIGAQHAAGYADCLQRLLANPDLGHHMADQAYAKVRRERNWSAFCQHITEQYAELAETDQCMATKLVAAPSCQSLPSR